jgi:hypothetical protein
LFAFRTSAPLQGEQFDYVKVYVFVKASIDADGRMLPMEIVWEDGRKHQINKI